MCKYMFYICDTVYILYHYIFKYKVHMYIQIYMLCTNMFICFLYTNILNISVKSMGNKNFRAGQL